MDFELNYIVISLIVFVLIVILTIFLVKLDCDLTLLLYLICGKNGKSLKTKVIWIVGASSGIGEHLAMQMATSGSKLVISGTRQTKLEVSFFN